MATSIGSTIAIAAVLMRCAGSDLSVINEFAITILIADIYSTIQSARAIGTRFTLDEWLFLFFVFGIDAAFNVTSSFITDSGSQTKWHGIRKVLLNITVGCSDTSSKDHTGVAVGVAVPVSGTIKLA